MKVKFLFLILVLLFISSLYGFSGGNGTESSPWQISTVEELNSLRNYLGTVHTSKYFELINDIDLNVAPYNTGLGWEPVGTTATPFYGKFNGNSHVISNLFINRPTSDNIGLFGVTGSAQIKKVEIKDVNITGNNYIGALVGFCGINSKIINSSSSGSITGNMSLGGLLGTFQGIEMNNCYSTCNVTGNDIIAGLVGSIGKLQAPTNMTLAQTGATSVLLNWTDNSGCEQGYKVDRKVGTQEWQIAWQTLGVNSTNLVDTNLDLETFYSYRVYAYAGADSSEYSNETNYIFYPLQFVQGGTFNNGTSDVTVSSFYAGKYEVTKSEYVSVMGTNPSYFQVVNRCPVEQVSWFDTIEYCNKRSIIEGLTPCYSYLTYGTDPASWPDNWNTSGANHTNISCNWTANGYRLLTEAEWQFAARGGNLTNNYTFSGSSVVGAVAWYYSNSGNTTHTVGTKQANELGLYDMSGNIFEWCWDIFGEYPAGNQTDYHGALSGVNRINRGGSWDNIIAYCAVSFRCYDPAIFSGNYVGFRLCRASQ